MRHLLVAGFLYLVAPGLGQVHAEDRRRGGAMLGAAVVNGNLNIIFLPEFVGADPDPAVVWEYWIPRIGHDVMSLWSVVFWVWAVVDAVALGRREQADVGAVTAP